MGKGRIKGISFEIAGDTSPLEKALSGVNKKSRETQMELRDVQKLLKLDPTNTELLAQKQKLLANAVENTGDKLETLKIAEAQAQAQFKQGKISEEQYRALQREIIATEQDLKSLKSEADQTNGAMKELGEKSQRTASDMETTQKSAENLGGGMEKMGGLAAAGVAALGTAAVAAATYTVKFSVDYDKALNDVIAKTGAAEEETAGLETAMRNVYKNNFGEDIKDVAISISAVRQQTGLQNEELEKTTEYAILMRDTFEFEVNESIRASKMLVDQFGISYEDAYALIAQGAQQGLDKNGDLLDSLNEYGVHFEQLGLSASDMMNVFKASADNGAFSIDKAGDAVKEFGIRVKDGSDASRSAFAILGLDADKMTQAFSNGGEEANQAYYKVWNALNNMKDPVAQNTAGVSLFGTMWEDLGAKATLASMGMADNFDETASTLQDLNNVKYDDVGNSLKELGRIVETDVLQPAGKEAMPLVKEIIDTIRENMPGIKDAVSGVVTAISKVVKWIMDNGDTIIALLQGVVAGLIAMNVASAIIAVVGAIRAFTIATQGATIAQKLMNLVMSMNPIGLIVTAIGALVAAFVILWNKSEGFRNFWINLWEKIKTTTKAVVEKVVSIFHTVVDFFKNNWKSLLLLLVNPFAGAFKLLYDNCAGFRNFINNFIQGIKDFFVNAWNSIKLFFTETIPAFIQSVINWFAELPRNIGLLIGSLIGHIVKFGIDAWNWVTVELPKIILEVINWFAQLPGRVWEWLVNTIQKVKDWIVELYNKAKEAGQKFVTTVVDFIRSLPEKVWTWLKSVVDKVKNWVTSLINTAKAEIPKFINTIIDKIKELPGKFVDLGKNIVEGLWNGIKNMGNWIKDKIGSFAGGVVDGFKKALGINSPSRVLAGEVGRFLPPGIGVGFQSAMPALLSKIKENMANVVLAAKTNLSDIQVGIKAKIGSQILKDSQVAAAQGTHMENNSTSNQINVYFNGNYKFDNQGDIDYFMNQAAVRFKGVRA